MSDNYLIGQSIRVTGIFTGISGALVDPGVLTLKIKKPDSTVITFIYGTDAEVVKNSTGNYHADISINAAGNWWFRWESTVINIGAEELGISVNSSRVI